MTCVVIQEEILDALAQSVLPSDQALVCSDLGLVSQPFAMLLSASLLHHWCDDCWQGVSLHEFEAQFVDGPWQLHAQVNILHSLY